MNKFKTVSLYFAYYCLSLAPLALLIWGKQQVAYSIVSAIFAYVAIHFLRKEIKQILYALKTNK